MSTEIAVNQDDHVITPDITGVAVAGRRLKMIDKFKILMIGSTGAGKSTFINQLLPLGRERGREAQQFAKFVLYADKNLNAEYKYLKSSGEADLQETKAALQSVAKKVFEIKNKAEALHDTAEIKQCRALIRFISRELRYIESEFYNLYLQAVLWLLLFIAVKCDLTSRSLPVRVLSISQALEVVLIASGDVEENPGPTFLDGNYSSCIHTDYVIKEYGGQ